MKKTILKIIPFLVILIAISACKRDREPATRYKLGDGTYSVNCINCKTHGYVGDTLNYTSIRTSFNVIKGGMAKIGSESYLRITYLFDNAGNGSTFLIPYGFLTINGSNIYFDSDWRWERTNNLSLTIELYTGKGRKSEPLTITVPKPVGSN